MKKRISGLTLLILMMLVGNVYASDFIYGSNWRINKNTNAYQEIKELNNSDTIFESSPLVLGDDIYYCYKPAGFDLSHVNTSHANISHTVGANGGRKKLTEGIKGPNYIEIFDYKDGYLYCKELFTIFRIRSDGTGRQILHEEVDKSKTQRISRINSAFLLDDYIYYSTTEVHYYHNWDHTEEYRTYRKNLNTGKIESLWDDLLIYDVVRVGEDELYVETSIGIYSTNNKFDIYSKLVTGRNVKMEHVDGKYLYHTHSYFKERNKLMRLDVETKEDKLIIDGLAMGMANYILFEEGYIYNIKPDGVWRYDPSTESNKFIYNKENKNFTFIKQIQSPKSKSSEANIDVMVDNTKIKLDRTTGKVKVVDNKTMMPLRVLSEELHCDVAWDKVSNKTTISKDGVDIVISPGSSVVVLNGNKVVLDNKIQVNEDRIYVPLRFFSESMGLDVDYKDSVIRLTHK